MKRVGDSDRIEEEDESEEEDENEDEGESEDEDLWEDEDEFEDECGNEDEFPEEEQECKEKTSRSRKRGKVAIETDSWSSNNCDPHVRISRREDDSLTAGEREEELSDIDLGSCTCGNCNVLS